MTISSLSALLLGLSCAVGGLVEAPAVQSREPIAIIVHPTNPMEALSLDDLRRLYLGGVTLFDNRERVLLLESSQERVRFYRAALDMSEDRLKRHWVARVFAGDAGSPPEEFRDVGDLNRYVASHPGAIAFIPAASVGPGVKVIRIQGLRPGDARYPIY